MEKDPYRVIVLVLENPCRPARDRGLELGAVEALGLDLDALGALFFFWGGEVEKPLGLR